MTTISSTAATQVRTDGVMHQTDGNHAITLSTHTQSTNDDVQPSFVLVFIATIVMVYKITVLVSSQCRNRNAALQGKEQLTLFQWVYHWFIVTSQNNWFIVTIQNNWFIIGSLLSVSEQLSSNGFTTASISRATKWIHI